jgi:hypothetical protein
MRTALRPDGARATGLSLTHPETRKREASHLPSSRCDAGQVLTQLACGPLALCDVVFDAHPRRARYPSPWIALKCTKTSALPSSGVMNPKPFSALNHFTVPVAMMPFPPSNTVGAHLAPIRPRPQPEAARGNCS